LHYPKDTTIVIHHEDDARYTLTAPLWLSPGMSQTSENDERSERLLAELDVRRVLTRRPKDESQGPWLDARNEAAWEYLCQQQDIVGEPPSDAQVGLALSMFNNP
jgi:hypothetical protein